VLDMLPLARPADFGAQWLRMQRWKEEGHARYIGLAIAGNSFYDIVESAIRDGADFVQINYSILEPESGERLIPLAHDNGVAVVTNRHSSTAAFSRWCRAGNCPIGLPSSTVIPG